MITLINRPQLCDSREHICCRYCKYQQTELKILGTEFSLPLIIGQHILSSNKQKALCFITIGGSVIWRQWIADIHMY